MSGELKRVINKGVTKEEKSRKKDHERKLMKENS
jgi:hypothetical protein